MGWSVGLRGVDTKESIALISDMEEAFIIGRMDKCMMENGKPIIGVEEAYIPSVMEEGTRGIGSTVLLKAGGFSHGLMDLRTMATAVMD